MAGRDAFGALLLSLRDAPGLLPRLQRIAGSLGVLKRLGPRQRTVLLRMAGLGGAEPLLEHLIAGDDATLRAFNRLLDDFENRPEKLSEVVRGLLDPVERPAAAAALVRTLEEAVEEEAHQAEEPSGQEGDQAPPRGDFASDTHPAAGERDDEDDNEEEDDEEDDAAEAAVAAPVAPPAPPSPPPARAPAPAPAPSGPATPLRPIVPAASAAAAGVAAAAAVRSSGKADAGGLAASSDAAPAAAEPAPTAPPRPDPRTVEKPAPTPTAEPSAATGWEPEPAPPWEPGRRSEWDSHREPDLAVLRDVDPVRRDNDFAVRRDTRGPRSLADVAEQLHTEAPAWTRRRALQSWIEGADPAELSGALGRILELIATLDSPPDRMWCLTALAGRRAWGGEAWQQILDGAGTPSLRRRLAHRRRSPG